MKAYVVVTARAGTAEPVSAPPLTRRATPFGPAADAIAIVRSTVHSQARMRQPDPINPAQADVPIVHLHAPKRGH